MSDTKMSQEMAEKEFERWADSMGLDFCGTEKEMAAIKSLKGAVVRAFMRGALVLDDDGSLEYTVSDKSPEGIAGDKVKIGEMNGRVWLAMDGYKETEQMHKLASAASALTGKDISWFGKLSGKDFNFFTGVVGLFMSA